MFTRHPRSASSSEAYVGFHRRVLRWQDDAARLLQPPTGEFVDRRKLREQVETELAAIQAYVAGLEKRAEEARGIVARALIDGDAAAGAVAEARAIYERLVTRYPAPDLAEQLAAADEKLRQAREAIGRKGAERPLTGVRLAGEAKALARQVAQEAATLLALPERIDAQLAEFPAARARVDDEIAEAREELQSAADHHAPVSWLELHGVGATADRALERALEHYESAQRCWTVAKHDAALLREVGREVAEAFADLEQAAAAAAQIRDHVARLEQAVREARQKLEAAEAEIDETLAVIHQLPADEDGTGARREHFLERASELVTRAREELTKPEPDWLAIVNWADRGWQLAEGSCSQVLPDVEALAQLRELLATEKERTKGTCDQAWALFLAIEPLNPDRDTLRVSVTVAEHKFQDALAKETVAVRSHGQPGEAPAIRDATTALRTAEEAALVACERARPVMPPPMKDTSWRAVWLEGHRGPYYGHDENPIEAVAADIVRGALKGAKRAVSEKDPR